MNRFAKVLAVVLMTCIGTGCGLDRPANSVALSFYMRNLSAQPFYFQIRGSHPVPIEGPVQDRPASTGCGYVGRDWMLVVTEGQERPDPADDFAAQLDAGGFGNRDPISISLSVEADLSIVVEEGVPSWWDSDIQRCPGL